MFSEIVFSDILGSSKGVLKIGEKITCRENPIGLFFCSGILISFAFHYVLERLVLKFRNSQFS